MATSTYYWDPFGVGLDLTVEDTSVTRVSKTSFSVTMNVKWRGKYAGTNYGMTVTSGGTTIGIPYYNGTAYREKSGTLTGTYNTTTGAKQDVSIDVTFTNYKDDVNPKPSKSHTIKHTVTVSAWTSYNVTFDINGGIRTGGGALSQTIYKNDDATVPIVSRAGYTLSGWSDSYTNITSAKTITAVWTANKYDVTFDTNGGTVDSASIEVTYDSTYGPLPTPTRQNYIFAGWYTERDGGNQVQSSTTVSITRDQTLYARWILDAYIISYEDNGGTDGPGQQAVIIGETGIISSKIPKRHGYTFLGWSAGTVNSAIVLQPGNSFPITGDITMYALWEAWTYSIKYDPNNGIGNYTECVICSSDTPHQLQNASLVGPSRDFYCWNTARDGSGVSYMPGDYFYEHQDGGTITLYAMYLDKAIYFYKSGRIECLELVEELNCSTPRIEKSGQLVASRFIVHDGDIIFQHGNVYAKEFVEVFNLVSGGVFATQDNITDVVIEKVPVDITGVILTDINNYILIGE